MICLVVSRVVLCIFMAMVVTMRFDLRRLPPPALLRGMDLMTVA